METVTLKAKDKDGHWNLVPGPEFTREELEPFTEQMAKIGVEILQDGESVRVPFITMTKEQVFDALSKVPVGTDKPGLVMAYCEKIINGAGGLKAFEHYEMAVPNCDRDVAIAAWVIRCLGNGGDEAGEVVAAIVERRVELAEQVRAMAARSAGDE